MASVTNLVESRRPAGKAGSRTEQHPPSFYEEKTVVTKRPFFAKGKGLPPVSENKDKKSRFETILLLDEKPMSTPEREIDETTRYIIDLGKRLEKAEETEKLPDLSKEVKEVA